MTPEQASPAWLHDFLKPRPDHNTDTLHPELLNHLLCDFQPATGPERLKVEEMAQAWLEIWRLHQQSAALKALQQDQADRHYQLITLNHYARLSRDLHKNPAGHFLALIKHPLGIDLLVERWRPIAQRLETNQPVDLEHMQEALLLSGFSDNIRSCGEFGMQLALAFLRLQKDPSLAITRWLVRSGVKSSQTRELYQRVNQMLDARLDPDVARSFLNEYIQKRILLLKNRRQKYATEYEKACLDFRQAYQADRGIVASLRTLESFRQAQHNRLNKLQRELKSLERERLKDDHTQLERQARLEAIRNGHAQPGQRRTRTPQTNPTESQSRGADSPDSPVIAISENSFPEAELIQAVHQSAASFENAPTVEPQTKPTPGKKAEAPAPSDFIARARNVIADWSPAELANPFLRPGFREIHQKSNRRKRKTLSRLIADEKARRHMPTSLQPSG